MATKGTEETKVCYIICPIGEPGTSVRLHADQVLTHLIRPVVDGQGYDVRRSDTDARPGIITAEIIQQMAGAELVIADLSNHNPNVFYELAIRHVAAKPFIQMIKEGDPIPFDVAPMRTVRFDLTNPDRVVEARKELEAQVAKLQDVDQVETPVHVGLGLKKLLESAEPGDIELGEILSELRSLRSTVESIRTSQPVPSSAFVSTPTNFTATPMSWIDTGVDGTLQFKSLAGDEPVSTVLNRPQEDPPSGSPGQRRKGGRPKRS